MRSKVLKQTKTNSKTKKPKNDIHTQKHAMQQKAQKSTQRTCALLPLPAQQPNASLNPKTSSLPKVFFEEVLSIPPQLHKEKKTTTKHPQKTKNTPRNIIPSGFGELGSDPAERTAKGAVDPTNLNQIILAEGKNSEPNRTRTQTPFFNQDTGRNHHICGVGHSPEPNRGVHSAPRRIHHRRIHGADYLACA
jgi:hypothetical protein